MNQRYELHNGDCLEVLRGMADCSVDAVVTDPPAGIAFMGKGWDSDKGGRGQWIAWLEERARELLRVLKPGGHALVWALPRTSHWTATALEDAGFEIRDRVTHIFGSGFPKGKRVNDDPRFCQCAVSGRSAECNTHEPRPADHKNKAAGASDSDLPHEDVGHCSNTGQDSQGDCQRDCDSHDEPPLHTQAASQALAPSQRYVQERSHSAERVGGSGHELGRIPSPAPHTARLSSQGSTLHDCSQIATDGDTASSKEQPHKKGLGIESPESHKRNMDGFASSYNDFATGFPRCQACGKPNADGWNVALKPAAEDWWLCRKPLIGTVAANVLAHGTGALNVGACRVEVACQRPDGMMEGWEKEQYLCDLCAASAASKTKPTRPALRGSIATKSAAPISSGKGKHPQGDTAKTGIGCFVGQFPVELSESQTGDVNSSTEECGELPEGKSHMDGIYTTSMVTKATIGLKTCSACGAKTTLGFTQQNGRWPSNLTLDESAAAMLDEQSGESAPKDAREGKRGGRGFGDFDHEKSANAIGFWPADQGGGASRFFYCAKASTADRNEGLEGDVSTHPTVKNTDLMRWLIRLITPPDGVVLDAFMGSGSTGKAAMLENVRFIGIELDPAYFAIAERRIKHAAAQRRMF